MLDFLQQYSGALTFLATLILVALTAFYAYWTKGILAATANQSRLSLNPVIGIEVREIGISKVFGPGRRNMGIELVLSNVGNAPAIEVLVDAELELRYSSINEERVIPSRFEPNMIPFIRPGESSAATRPTFGNRCITHFFDDVRESARLNAHRLETEPRKDPYRTSRLRVVVYYRNSLEQHFKSQYETEIRLEDSEGGNLIPLDDASAEVTQIYLPRPIFHAGISDELSTEREIQARNAKRDLSGW